MRGGGGWGRRSREGDIFVINYSYSQCMLCAIFLFWFALALLMIEIYNSRQEPENSDKRCLSSGELKK